MPLPRPLSALTLVSLGALGLTGCAGAAFIGRPVIGAASLYSSTNASEWVNEQTKLGNKAGEGCVTSILGIVTTGDASVNSAAHQANINRVTHVDHKFENILGLYAKYCVTVYGD